MNEIKNFTVVGYDNSGLLKLNVEYLNKNNQLKNKEVEIEWDEDLESEGDVDEEYFQFCYKCISQHWDDFKYEILEKF